MCLKIPYTLLRDIHLALVIQFYYTQTDLGKLLHTSLECLMMEHGMHKHPFEYKYKKYSHTVTKLWMKHLWEVYSIRKITLRRVGPSSKPNRKKKPDGEFRQQRLS